MTLNTCNSQTYQSCVQVPFSEAAAEAVCIANTSHDLSYWQVYWPSTFTTQLPIAITTQLFDTSLHVPVADLLLKAVHIASTSNDLSHGQADYCKSHTPAVCCYSKTLCTALMHLAVAGTECHFANLVLFTFDAGL